VAIRHPISQIVLQDQTSQLASLVLGDGDFAAHHVLSRLREQNVRFAGRLDRFVVENDSLLVNELVLELRVHAAAQSIDRSDDVANVVIDIEDALNISNDL
jgi:hypothetical protein